MKIEEVANKLIKKSRLGMSKFQIKNFIINDQITDYKKLKQCLLELRTRYEILKDIDEEMELKLVDRDELEFELKNENNEFAKKRKQIKRKQIKRQLDTIVERKENIEYEIESLEEYLAELIQKYGVEKIEEMLDNQENYEIEYWTKKFTRSVYQDLLSNGRISTTLLESISNVSDEIQENIFEEGFKNFIKTSEDINMLQNAIKINLIENKKNEEK
jgi:hypothetical protein